MKACRQFNIVLEKIAVAAAQDLVEIVAPSTNSIRLVNLEITQDTEEADAQSEMLSILIHKGSTSGSGGSTVTPRPVNHGVAYTGTAEGNNTSQSTEGEKLWSGAFNVMAGLDKYWSPDMRMETNVGPSERLIIELQDTPADSVTVTINVLFEQDTLI